jgi:ADP-ribosylation factor related protein 1
MGVREVKPIFHDNVENIGNRECMVLPTSGLAGDGVAEGIDWLVQCIKRNGLERPPKGHGDDE